MEKENVSAKVLDFNNYKYDEKARLEEVREADYVGISVKTFTMPEALRLIKAVKSINPHAVIISGGIHLMVDGLRFMEDNPLIDIGILGEGEKVLSQIVKEKPLKDIPGIIFREESRAKRTEAENKLLEMDELPFPSYRSFDSYGSRQKKLFPFRILSPGDQQGLSISVYILCSSRYRVKEVEGTGPRETNPGVKEG